MIKIILANAPINNGNRGCVALSYCAIYLIDQVLGKGKYELYLTDSYETEGKHIISLAGREIVYESIVLPNIHTTKGLIKMVRKFKQKVYALRLFNQSDIVFDIGQGDSFADIYGKGRFKNIDRIHCLARLFNKKYILLPQTIGPFCDERISQKAVKSICKASFVMARDRQSLDYVKQIAPDYANVREYIDVAFFLPFTKKVFDKTKIHVGLNVSALLWNGGYTGKNELGLKCDYQKTIRKIINYFLSLDEVVLYLIPHVVLQERNIENDYAISFDLCEEFNSERLVLAPFFLSPIDAKSYISGLDFFMGARMHATIAAFSAGVPVVPMAYSRKFNGLFVDTLHYDSIVDMKKDPAYDVIGIIKKAYNNRQMLSDIIQERQNTIVDVKKQQLLNDLKTILL